MPVIWCDTTLNFHLASQKSEVVHHFNLVQLEIIVYSNCTRLRSCTSLEALWAFLLVLVHVY